MIGEVVPAIQRYCVDEGRGLIVGAFVYGSVATGSARPGSDIDCFALVADAVTSGQRRRLAARFADLQRHLGYLPDAGYPIELFTAARCRDALSDALVLRVIRDAATGVPPGPPAAESDDLEIFRALVGTRLMVVDCEEFEPLARQAWGLLSDLPQSRLRRVLSLAGVKHAQPVDGMAGRDLGGDGAWL